jgi:hypothetical protein
MLLGRRPARGEHQVALRAGRWSNLESRIVQPAHRLAGAMGTFGTSMRALGPYAAIALTVPGGSLIALAMLGMKHRAALPPLRAVVLAAFIAASILLPASG